MRPWSPERDAATVLAAFEASAGLHRQAPPVRTRDDARDHPAAIADEALAIDVDGTAVGCVMASSRALSRALFDDGLHGLELGGRAYDPASIAVAARAGCLREGVERQRLRYLDEQGRDERFDVVRLARLATDPSPDLVPLELA